jgi:hypothetical protein
LETDDKPVTFAERLNQAESYINERLAAREIACCDSRGPAAKKGEPHVQSETARVCHGARFGGMASVRGDEELAAAWLHRSFDRLIRTSMARNAKQINAPVGAEVFSLAQQQFEKYGSRASNKPCDFNYIKNPYQIPVVQRSREKPRRENTGDAIFGIGGAELRRESPAKRGDFHVVASQERKLAMTRLAEREELGSNILHLGGRRYDGHLVRNHVHSASNSDRIGASQRTDAVCHKRP